MTNFELRLPNWVYGGDCPGDWAGQYICANTIGFDRHFQLYNDIVDWIWDNVEDPKSNAQWNKIGDCIYVYIRKPNDYFLFSLRWGQ